MTAPTVPLFHRYHRTNCDNKALLTQPRRDIRPANLYRYVSRLDLVLGDLRLPSLGFLLELQSRLPPAGWGCGVLCPPPSPVTVLLLVTSSCVPDPMDWAGV